VSCVSTCCHIRANHLRRKPEVVLQPSPLPVTEKPDVHQMLSCVVHKPNGQQPLDILHNLSTLASLAYCRTLPCIIVIATTTTFITLSISPRFACYVDHLPSHFSACFFSVSPTCSSRSFSTYHCSFILRYLDKSHFSGSASISRPETSIFEHPTFLIWVDIDHLIY
jgi:hypothetical protein